MDKFKAFCAVVFVSIAVFAFGVVVLSFHARWSQRQLPERRIAPLKIRVRAYELFYTAGTYYPRLGWVGEYSDIYYSSRVEWTGTIWVYDAGGMIRERIPFEIPFWDGRWDTVYRGDQMYRVGEQLWLRLDSVNNTV